MRQVRFYISRLRNVHRDDLRCLRGLKSHASVINVEIERPDRFAAPRRAAHGRGIRQGAGGRMKNPRSERRRPGTEPINPHRLYSFYERTVTSFFTFIRHVFSTRYVNLAGQRAVWFLVN